MSFFKFQWCLLYHDTQNVQNYVMNFLLFLFKMRSSDHTLDSIRRKQSSKKPSNFHQMSISISNCVVSPGDDSR